MANVVHTVTKTSGTQHTVIGNKKLRFFDITTDTGNYVTGGSSLTASQFGLKKIDAITACSASTSGTAGATSLAVGFTRASTGASVTVQYYESAATGLIMLEKTGAEAMPSNQTVSVTVIGT